MFRGSFSTASAVCGAVQPGSGPQPDGLPDWNLRVCLSLGMLVFLLPCLHPHRNAQVFTANSPILSCPQRDPWQINSSGAKMLADMLENNRGLQELVLNLNQVRLAVCSYLSTLVRSFAA